MSYSPENNPYVPGDPYMYDLKWIIHRLNRLEAAKAIVTDLTSTAYSDVTNTSGYVITDSITIDKAGIYLISATGYQSTDGYVTADESVMGGELIIELNRSGSAINSVITSSSLLQGGDKSACTLFDCEAGDTINIKMRQIVGAGTVPLVQQHFHSKYTISRLGPSAS